MVSPRCARVKLLKFDGNSLIFYITRRAYQPPSPGAYNKLRGTTTSPPSTSRRNLADRAAAAVVAVVAIVLYS